MKLLRNVLRKRIDSKKVCVLDVPMRWNSTYIMLETALGLKQAFDRLAEEEESKYIGSFDEDEDEDDDSENLVLVTIRKGTKRIGPPVEADWNNSCEFVKVLKVFYDTTVVVSATNRPTAHKSFFEIATIRSEIEDMHSNDPNEMQGASKTVSDMAVQMKSKYIKYFNVLDDMNQLLLVALVLDLRFKLKYFSRILKKMLNENSRTVKKKTDELNELIVTITDTYASTSGTSSFYRVLCV
ncbi:unnamed protein product [Cuscuta europaea]|uniref:hAT-like transposase RNase-H fold domain-containing protein n=1 Tax=Cuscuta europaea TaxID=41803 RepID=A0A9P1E7K7_CUSEU|nr:unnamed protein product [Cuscuta europaea]